VDGGERKKKEFTALGEPRELKFDRHGQTSPKATLYPNLMKTSLFIGAALLSWTARRRRARSKKIKKRKTSSRRRRRSGPAKKESAGRKSFERGCVPQRWERRGDDRRAKGDKRARLKRGER